MKKIIPLILFVTIVSCDPQRVYEENKDIDDAIWKSDDIQRFDFNIEDRTANYDLHFNIRSTLSYPFQNLYIQFNLRDSTESILATELKEFHLFDAKTGEPQGDGLGDLFDNRFPILENHSFGYPGSYTVDFQQFMRLDSLPMVVSVGLRVEVGNSE